MNFSTAKSEFFNLVKSLNNDDRSDFLSWCKEYFSSESSYSDAYINLRTIAEEIKTLLPIDAILPTEQVNHSKIDDQTPVIHVDSFLFEDDQVDTLVEEGKLSRDYCKECGSMKLAPITFVSHSTSVQRIEFIFKHLLPDLSDKILLDVGSRLGAILYGAYYCSSASKIVGVEINSDLCKLQNHIIQNYNLNDRIQVLHNNICNIPDVVQAANVIIFNNVFECFMSKEAQEQTWVWLRNHITRPGTILVTVPSIEETLNPLETGIDISAWLRKAPVSDTEITIQMDDQDLLKEICTYYVI